MQQPHAELLRQARPHLMRAGLGLLALTVGLIAASFGELRGPDLEWRQRLPVIGGALLVLIGGVIMVRAVARALRAMTEAHLGDARGASLAFLFSLLGYTFTMLVVLQALDVELGGLLVGGAITGVVLGIAAQQTLGNFFAGLVLLLNRPFAVGEEIVLRSGPLGGEYDGRVTDISLFYVSMVTENGPVQLPNASVLMSAIGPGAKAPTDEDEAEEEERAPTGAGGAPDHSKGVSG
jgi:small-conductance mechanosensitive channel